MPNEILKNNYYNSLYNTALIMAVNIKKDFGNTRSRKPDLTTLVYGKVPPQAPGT